MAKVKKEITREEQELFNELKKLSKRANQRIVRLEREFGKDTWGTKYLKEKLEAEPLQAWTKKGRVKANKSMSSTQMKATIKATKEFLNNTSITTKRGIKKAKQKAIKTLKIRFSTDVSEISYQEAEALTMFFEDKEVNGITNFIPGSNVLPVIEEAREQNTDYSTFASQMESIIQWNKGKSIENILRKIYAKYIYKGNQNSDELEMLYSNILELIANSLSENDLQEVESIIANLFSEGKIDEKEYNYLLNAINDKRKEI
jgi:hypothetical protein